VCVAGDVQVFALNALCRSVHWDCPFSTMDQSLRSASRRGLGGDVDKPPSVETRGAVSCSCSLSESPASLVADTAAYAVLRSLLPSDPWSSQQELAVSPEGVGEGASVLTSPSTLVRFVAECLVADPLSLDQINAVTVPVQCGGGPDWSLSLSGDVSPSTSPWQSTGFSSPNDPTTFSLWRVPGFKPDDPPCRKLFRDKLRVPAFMAASLVRSAILAAPSDDRRRAVAVEVAERAWCNAYSSYSQDLPLMDLLAPSSEATMSIHSVVSSSSPHGAHQGGARRLHNRSDMSFGTIDADKLASSNGAEVSSTDRSSILSRPASVAAPSPAAAFPADVQRKAHDAISRILRRFSPVRLGDALCIRAGIDPSLGLAAISVRQAAAVLERAPNMPAAGGGGGRSEDLESHAQHRRAVSVGVRNRGLSPGGSTARKASHRLQSSERDLLSRKAGNRQRFRGPQCKSMETDEAGDEFPSSLCASCAVRNSMLSCNESESTTWVSASLIPSFGVVDALEEKELPDIAEQSSPSTSDSDAATAHPGEGSSSFGSGYRSAEEAADKWRKLSVPNHAFSCVQTATRVQKGLLRESSSKASSQLTNFPWSPGYGLSRVAIALPSVGQTMHSIATACFQQARGGSFHDAWEATRHRVDVCIEKLRTEEGVSPTSAGGELPLAGDGATLLHSPTATGKGFFLPPPSAPSTPRWSGAMDFDATDDSCEAVEAMAIDQAKKNGEVVLGIVKRAIARWPTRRRATILQLLRVITPEMCALGMSRAPRPLCVQQGLLSAAALRMEAHGFEDAADLNPIHTSIPSAVSVGILVDAVVSKHCLWAPPRSPSPSLSSPSSAIEAFSHSLVRDSIVKAILLLNPPSPEYLGVGPAPTPFSTAWFALAMSARSRRESVETTNISREACSPEAMSYLVQSCRPAASLRMSFLGLEPLVSCLIERHPDLAVLASDKARAQRYATFVLVCIGYALGGSHATGVSLRELKKSNLGEALHACAVGHLDRVVPFALELFEGCERRFQALSGTGVLTPRSTGGSDWTGRCDEAWSTDSRQAAIACLLDTHRYPIRSATGKPLVDAGMQRLLSEFGEMLCHPAEADHVTAWQLLCAIDAAVARVITMACRAVEAEPWFAELSLIGSVMGPDTAATTPKPTRIASSHSLTPRTSAASSPGKGSFGFTAEAGAGAPSFSFHATSFYIMRLASGKVRPLTTGQPGKLSFGDWVWLECVNGLIGEVDTDGLMFDAVAGYGGAEAVTAVDMSVGAEERVWTAIRTQQPAKSPASVVDRHAAKTLVTRQLQAHRPAQVARMDGLPHLIIPPSPIVASPESDSPQHRRVDSVRSASSLGHTRSSSGGGSAMDPLERLAGSRVALFTDGALSPATSKEVNAYTATVARRNRHSTLASAGSRLISPLADDPRSEPLSARARVSEWSGEPHPIPMTAQLEMSAEHFVVRRDAGRILQQVIDVLRPVVDSTGMCAPVSMLSLRQSGRGKDVLDLLVARPAVGQAPVD
jgi:hypothetical protein